MLYKTSAFRATYAAASLLGCLTSLFARPRGSERVPAAPAPETVVPRLLSRPIPVRRRSFVADRGSYVDAYMERYRNDYSLRGRDRVGLPGSREKRKRDPRRSARNQTCPRSHVRRQAGAPAKHVR